MLKSYNLLFYLLSLILGFFLGVSYATIVEAGKGQMLAGGAIVLGYGVMGSIIILAVSIIITRKYRNEPSLIVKLNKLITLLIIGFYLFFYIKFKNREKAKQEVGLNIKTNTEQMSNNPQLTCLPFQTYSLGKKAEKAAQTI